MEQDFTFRQPRVVDFHRTTKGTNHRSESTSQIAETDNAYTTTGKEQGIPVAAEAVLLFALAEGAIVLAYTARQVEGQRQGHFGHGDSKCGAGDEHANATRKTKIVIDVW